jgi:holin-like protein
MKYLKQMTIIMLVSCAGEILHSLLPLPVPASIYGMILLFLLLEGKAVKLEQVDETAQFFMAIMPILFVDANVKLMTVVGGIRNQLIGILVISALSTVVVTAVTGLVSQKVITLRSKRKHK